MVSVRITNEGRILLRSRKLNEAGDNMKEKIPVEKNREYILEIASLGYEGEGVGKVEEFTVFVNGALPGERVRVLIVKVSKHFAFGKLLEIISASEKRTEPICSIYKRCGGCQLQHLSYEGQLEFKRKHVEETMKRIGKLGDVVVHPAIGMETPNRYRNKVQLPVGGTSEEIKIGFYAPRSHDIIDMDVCHIQDETADAVIRLIRQWMKDYKVEPYDEQGDKGILRHIMIRRAYRTEEIMVVLVTKTDSLPNVSTLIDTLVNKIEKVKSIIQNINKKNTNVILGEENKVIWGEGTITDYIGKFKFQISPHSFFQVNPVQTEVLYEKALEYAALTGNETVFDAYCGTGTISLFLSQKAGKVYGVEIVQQAIENAIENAKENDVYNTEFIVGASEEVIPRLIDQGICAEVVVVDPPRKGCGRELLEAIAKMKPKRIVYVSCDPGTLARDLGILQELHYKTVEIQPVDMFPHTAHIENVARIVLEN